MESLQMLLMQALDVFFYVLELLIFIRIILSWLPIGYGNSIMRLIYNLTEPILGPVRGMVERSPIGGGMGLDISPVFALILLRLVKMALVYLVMLL
ncbi:MAG: YggT family protein [Anaerotignum sp.]|nr:YggT family protein [Anaerotignum sp.]